MAQVDYAAPDRSGIPRRGLRDHLLGAIDARDAAGRGRPGQGFDAYAGSEPDLQDPVVRLNIEQPDRRTGERAVGTRHDPAAQPAQ